MGVIHKLKPEIRDFILETQKNNLKIGCRKIAALVYEKFQVEVSKSTINTLVKDSGLSLPVGRRRLKPFSETPIKKVIETAAQAVLAIEAPPEISVLAAPKEEPAAALPLEQPAPPEEIKLITPAPQEEKPAEEKPLEPLIEKPLPEKPVVPDENLALPEVKPAQIEVVAAPISVETTGAIILKAADFLFGGAFYLSEIIKNRLISRPADALALTETLLYAPLCNISFNQPVAPDNPLWSLTKKKFTIEEIKAFLNECEQMKAMNKELFSSLQKIFRPIKGIQATLADGSVFYFDGQFHTLWSTKDTPDDFSTTICNIKSYINSALIKTGPFILLQAQGFDTPTKELADFIFSLDSGQNALMHLTVYDRELNSVDTLHLEPAEKRGFIFGLWPWQFSRYRKVSLSAEFKQFHFAALNKDFFLSEGKIDLSLPGKSGPASLRLVALKTTPAEKIKLALVTNLPVEKIPTEEAANAYLLQWPNPQESFDKFNRSLELFTYTGNSAKGFEPEKIKSGQENTLDIKQLLDYYLRGLDLFVRRSLLPAGEEEKDFASRKARFYDLKATLRQEGEILRAIFHPAAGYAALPELEFICNRLNEKGIKAQNGLKVWFIIGS